MWRKSTKYLKSLKDVRNQDFSKTSCCIEDAILRNTEITQEHLTPEIKLRLLTPNCSLYHANYDSRVEFSKDPFWSIYWPGGQGLTRFILDEGPAIFKKLNGTRGAKVLDLGAGCGASAIAAKLAGASDVLANDIDKVACMAAEMNAKLNNVDIRTSEENLLEQHPKDVFDVILIGDLLYDVEVAEKLISWLENVIDGASAAPDIFLGDPGRHGLTDDLRKRLLLLRRYELPENVRRENYGYDAAGVWKFQT